MTLTKIKICRVCGEHNLGLLLSDDGHKDKEVCLTCDNDTFQEVEAPEVVRCVYCKREHKVSDLLKQWISIPFYSHREGTFYCGCYGWD